MSSIEFQGSELTSPIDIQINPNDLFKVALEKFAQKAHIDLRKVIFLGDGQIIQENTLIKDILKNRNKLKVIVQSINEDDENILVESKEVICPECKEPCRFQIENYKIKLFNCKNGHTVKNIQMKEFQDKQKINYSDIICDECKENNKGRAQDHKFNYCLSCKKNLCLLCGYRHDKAHKQINHDNKNYICSKHNELFSKFCEDCQQNICILCEDEHVNHKIESFSNIMPDINKSKSIHNELKNSINLFNNKIKRMSDDLIENFESLDKITGNMIKSFESQNRNYQILKNINEINLQNKLIIDEIHNIINEGQLTNIIKIYNKLKDIKNLEEINKKEEQKNNKYITPILKDESIMIYNNLIKFVCKIQIKKLQKLTGFFEHLNKNIMRVIAQGTGFFAKIPYNSKIIHVLITESNTVSSDSVKNKDTIIISINNGETIKNIILDEKRKIYVNNKLKTLKN